MGWTKSKYKVEDTQRWTLEALTTLEEEKRDMTCAEIQRANYCLVELTPQKLSRCLGELVERGLVAKTKGKDGLMHYKSVSVILGEGYRLEEMVY